MDDGMSRIERWRWIEFDVLGDGRTVGPNGPIVSFLPLFDDWQLWTEERRAHVQALSAAPSRAARERAREQHLEQLEAAAEVEP